MTRWNQTVEAPLGESAVIVSTNYTATTTNRAVFVSTTAADRVVTLPRANGLGAGVSQMLCIASSGGVHTLTVVVQSGDKIRSGGVVDNDGSIVIASALFFSDGVDTWEQL